MRARTHEGFWDTIQHYLGNVNLGIILAVAFIMNSVDLLLIPWSKEGQSHYPYRYASVVCLKHILLLILYLLWIAINACIHCLRPKNISQSHTVDPLELEVFDTVNAMEDIDEDSIELTTFGGGPHIVTNDLNNIKRHNNGSAVNSNSNQPRTLLICCKEGLVFWYNGLMILVMDICIFNILAHMPASTFAIIRNLVVPCTAAIRGFLFREKPSGIQWLALIGITAATSSFASQDMAIFKENKENDSDQDTETPISAEWFWLGSFFMLLYIVLESINIVYMEKKFKSALSQRMSFTEQQFWVTFYSAIFTFFFWLFDDWSTFIGKTHHGPSGVFRGYSVKTIFLLIWRVMNSIIVFAIVKYLTSVAATLVHTTASLGTSVLEWLLLSTQLEIGQWFDALATASLVLIYKIAPYEPHEQRRFEILDVTDMDED